MSKLTGDVKRILMTPKEVEIAFALQAKANKEGVWNDSWDAQWEYQDATYARALHTIQTLWKRNERMIQVLRQVLAWNMRAKYTGDPFCLTCGFDDREHPSECPVGQAEAVLRSLKKIF